MRKTEEIKAQLKNIIERKKKFETNEEYKELLNEENKLKEELNLAVREEFILSHNIFEKYENLMVLVGASPEPIIRTILCVKPRRVLFIYTQDVEKFLDRIVTETNLKASEFEKKKVDGSKPEEIYDIAKEYAIKWKNLAADISGGKKSMVAGMSIAAAFYGLPILYNDYKEYDVSLRMPKPGTEFLDELKNPYESSQDLLNRIAAEIFDRKDYYGAGLIFKEASHRGSNKLTFEIKSHLAFAYHYWDVFDFDNAIRNMKKFLELLDYSNIDGCRFRKQFEILKKVAEIKPNNYFKSLKDSDKVKALIFTYYTSALRRQYSKKFEDGVLRLYRCCELVSQHRLALRDINTSKVDWSGLDDSVKERYKSIYSSILKTKDVGLENKIGLLSGYVLLKALKDDFFENPPLDLNEINKCLNIRNLSYIEHSIDTVNEKKFESMKEMTDKCIKRLCEMNMWEFKFDDFEFTCI